MAGMGLSFAGRPVQWFGVDAPDVVAPGIASLQAAVAKYGGAGITNPGGAVAALLDAGTAAVGTVGPAIDALSGNAPDVMGATHLAWVDNDKLSRVNSGPTASQDDVNTAKNLVVDMINQYQVAARLAASKRPSAATGGSAAATSRAAKASDTSAKTQDAPIDLIPIASPWTWIAVGGAVIVAGGVLVAVARSRSTA